MNKKIKTSILIISLIVCSSRAFSEEVLICKNDIAQKVEASKLEVVKTEVLKPSTSTVPLVDSGESPNAIKLVADEKLKLESKVTQDATAAASEQNKYDFLNIVKPCGLTLESGIIKNIKIGGLYDGYMNFFYDEGKNLTSNYNIGTVELILDTKFRDDKTFSRVMYSVNRHLEGYDNHFTEKISEAYIGHNFNKQQQLLLGLTPRTPIGVEGGAGPMELKFANRSQIARTFGSIRAVGVRNKGNYKYFDYDIGAYDSTRYLQDMFAGTEIVTWFNVKPLANVEKKTGKLTLGTGYTVGKRDRSYSVAGAYVAYDYKKFHTNFEYSNADGYNGTNNSGNKADGYYTSLLYDIHPKVQLACRYDHFDPNKLIHDNAITEYTAGATYSLTKNLKFFLNYVWTDRQNALDSSKFVFATRLAF